MCHILSFESSSLQFFVQLSSLQKCHSSLCVSAILVNLKSLPVVITKIQNFSWCSLGYLRLPALHGLYFCRCEIPYTGYNRIILRPFRIFQSGGGNCKFDWVKPTVKIKKSYTVCVSAVVSPWPIHRSKHRAVLWPVWTAKFWGICISFLI